MSKISQKIVELKREGMTHRAIVQKLGCSISTVSYHCRQAGLGDVDGKYTPPTKEEREMFQKLYDEGRTIGDVADIVGWHRSVVGKYITARPPMSVEESKKKMVENVSNRRRKVRAMAVEHKGGKCVKCGYNKCIAALDFHHIDPTQKDVQISMNSGWERIKEEIEKCILVCANCHREIHYELKMYLTEEGR